MGLLFSFLGVSLLTSMASITSMTSLGVIIGLIYSIKRINDKTWANNQNPSNFIYCK